MQIYYGADKSTLKKLTTNTQGAGQTGLRDLQVIAEEIAGVINLVIDRSDFEMPKFIREAVKKTLDDGYTLYQPTRGFMDLRDSITARLKTKNNIQVSDVFIMPDSFGIGLRAMEDISVGRWRPRKRGRPGMHTALSPGACRRTP